MTLYLLLAAADVALLILCAWEILLRLGIEVKIIITRRSNGN